MPITEEKALEILAELIKKPESKAEDIPKIWGEIIGIYNQQFAPPAEAAPKRRRRRALSPNAGWPAGVKREEYKAWKEKQMARGISENLNPQEYKRLRDAGMAEPKAAKAPKAEAPKKKALAKAK